MKKIETASSNNFYDFVDDFEKVNGPEIQDVNDLDPVNHNNVKHMICTIKNDKVLSNYSNVGNFGNGRIFELDGFGSKKDSFGNGNDRNMIKKFSAATGSN